MSVHHMCIVPQGPEEDIGSLELELKTSRGLIGAGNLVLIIIEPSLQLPPLSCAKFIIPVLNHLSETVPAGLELEEAGVYMDFRDLVAYISETGSWYNAVLQDTCQGVGNLGPSLRMPLK